MYKCQMPDCDYMCEDKSQINFHHIVPQSMGGSNNPSNLIELCPNCHARVYVPEMKHGTHSIKHSNSVILHGIFLSTGGYVLNYQYIGNDESMFCVIDRVL